MNEIINKTNQTPIEIALGVDKKGRTTARKLYEFLELNQSNYSKWIRRNITENEFAAENEDYIPFVPEDERGFNPKPTTDYQLTATFAKKLSMTAKNQKGEQARNYFIKVEDAAVKMASHIEKTNTPTEIDRNRIMLMNAKTRMANTYLKLAKVETLSTEYKNILVAKASETLAGKKLIPLPKVIDKTMTAKEVGKILGITANMVGRIANAHNIKIPKFGEYRRDKSKYSVKEVDAFVYYPNAIDEFKKYV